MTKRYALLTFLLIGCAQSDPTLPVVPSALCAAPGDGGTDADQIAVGDNTGEPCTCPDPTTYGPCSWHRITECFDGGEQPAYLCVAVFPPPMPDAGDGG